MTDVKQLNDALAANYLLVSMSLRSWSGKKTDRIATGELITSKQATADSGAFVKNLLASAGGELKKVHQMGNALRQFVYASTLPWFAGSEGAMRGERLLATTKSMDFLRDLSTIKKEYDAAVVELVTAWPTRMQEAMKNLGQLADAADYPSSSQLPEMFSMTVDLRPVPSVSDFDRLNVPSHLAQALGDRHMQQAEIQVQNAMNDLRTRLTTELERISTQLGKHARGEKTRLYDSLVTNMQSLVGLARSMNVMANPKLDELTTKIEQQLLAQPVDAYRSSISLAETVSKAAQDLALEAAVDEIWK
jgi:hypothetical protein